MFHKTIVQENKLRIIKQIYQYQPINTNMVKAKVIHFVELLPDFEEA